MSVHGESIWDFANGGLLDRKWMDVACCLIVWRKIIFSKFLKQLFYMIKSKDFLNINFYLENLYICDIVHTTNLIKYRWKLLSWIFQIIQIVD